MIALIEIDGLPINSMVDLSMANCECHNQMVFFRKMMINHQICIRFALAAARLPALLSRGGLIQARILRGMHSVNGVHVC